MVRRRDGGSRVSCCGPRPVPTTIRAWRSGTSVQFAVRLPASLLTRVRDHCMERFVEDALREKLRRVGREGDGEDD